MADKVCSICRRTNKSEARYCHYCGFPMDISDRNPRERASILKKAAEKGYAAAQNQLGNCYLGGEGVSQDYNQAVYWYRKAAEQGYANAQNNLGHCY